jgi:hypothetical protein
MWGLLAIWIPIVLISSSGALQARKPYVPPALPTETEIAANVREEWQSSWSRQFAWEAGGRADAAALVRVGSVSCGYVFVTPQCEFEVTGRFSNGDEVTRKLVGRFDRDPQGKVVEVIVIYETRVRN